MLLQFNVQLGCLSITVVDYRLLREPAGCCPCPFNSVTSRRLLLDGLRFHAFDGILRNIYARISLGRHQQNTELYGILQTGRQACTRLFWYERFGTPRFSQVCVVTGNFTAYFAAVHNRCYLLPGIGSVFALLDELIISVKSAPSTCPHPLIRITPRTPCLAFLHSLGFSTLATVVTFFTAAARPHLCRAFGGSPLILVPVQKSVTSQANSRKETAQWRFAHFYKGPRTAANLKNCKFHNFCFQNDS